MSRYKIVAQTPESFSEQSIKVFLSRIQFVFSLQGKNIDSFFFDVQKTKDIGILGQLLVYKFMEYSQKKECFLHPKTNLKYDTYIGKEMKKMGFKKLVDSCFSEALPDVVNQEEEFRYKEEDSCFIAPVVLSRDSVSDKGIGAINIKKIRDYYSYNKDIAFAVLDCIGEISSNFQQHAVNDTSSVIVAKGDRRHFEIACADNGEGIITTLLPYYRKFVKSSYNILGCSIEKNVSSKKSEGHMGCGLWLVNEFVSKSKGVLSIYSERGYLHNKKGKIKCGESPFWQGTIIHLDIPLNNPSVFSEIVREAVPNKIKLNII